MNLSLIGKYRTQLMGIAILWVMFFHSGIYLSNPILALIKSIGYGGVDIFIFLSGFGILYSLDKDSDTKKFYKRRSFRILPYYIPIVFVVSLYYYINGVWGLKGAVSNILMLSYWLDLKERFDWYVPAISALYLLTPFIYKFFKKNQLVTTISIMTISILLWYIVHGTSLSYLIAFFARVPLYVMGMYLANYIKDNPNKKISRIGVISLFLYLALCIILLIISQKYRPHDENYLIFFYLSMFPTCLLISYILSLSKNFRYPVLTFFGTYTLTLYIFHERVLHFLNFNGFTFHLNIVAFVLTVFLAVFWKKAVDKVMDRYFN